MSAPVPAAAAALVAEGYPPRLAELLTRRGVDDGATAEAFLQPSLDQLHDPRWLAGVDTAVERLLQARAASETVALVGDYDVDGVSGSAILAAVLKKCGVRVETILPHRLRDGYGFQPSHVERAQDAGATVVVTIDCGTTSHAAIGAALDAGFDVVVTDHHLPGEPLPDAVVQINPRREDCDYPFDELSGAGLAFKLAVAFADAAGAPVDPRLLLRVACLGTIADLVPLRGENRVIAAIGLAELARTKAPGLRALIHVAGIHPPFSAADVGYRLGPRLNAPGRLGSADMALGLLLCRDPREAGEIARQIDVWNRERQEVERRVADEACAAVLERGELPPILVAWSEDWHRGVVGIAAGRLARRFNRPTVLLAVEGESATGSGRSIPGIHLHHFLSGWDKDLERFGGHAQAIGLSVAVERLEELRRSWENGAEEWADIVARRTFEHELEVDAGEADRGLLDELARLEPFGQGNREPIVKVRGPLTLVRPPRRFGTGHLSAEARAADGGRIRLVGWGWQDRAAALDGTFEVLGNLELDRYRGDTRLRLIDSRPYGG